MVRKQAADSFQGKGNVVIVPEWCNKDFSSYSCPWSLSKQFSSESKEHGSINDPDIIAFAFKLSEFFNPNQQNNKKKTKTKTKPA